MWYEGGIERKEKVQFSGFVEQAWKRQNLIQRLGSTLVVREGLRKVMLNLLLIEKVDNIA